MHCQVYITVPASGTTAVVARLSATIDEQLDEGQPTTTECIQDTAYVARQILCRPNCDNVTRLSNSNGVYGHFISLSD